MKVKSKAPKTHPFAKARHTGGRTRGGTQRRHRRVADLRQAHQDCKRQAELGELVALIKSGKRVALLCYCRDPKTCHRSRIVANVKKRTQVKVYDLIPPLF